MVFSEVLMVLKAPGFGQSMVYRRGQTPVGILSDGCLRHVLYVTTSFLYVYKPSKVT
ncbi:hypothetical protein MUK42_27363 [Musa troglodytarum]|uniref:Uncharacterized protein n=1 Tax=Musa troglodytarum TaxID=320322 RepID=A0A9E7F8B9_9LILI|nr:hypothetical protein MUK42_27363 [Musa troglodytarum]